MFRLDLKKKYLGWCQNFRQKSSIKKSKIDEIKKTSTNIPHFLQNSEQR